MLHPIPVSEVLRAQSVETRYRASDGSLVRDVRPLSELPQLIDDIEDRGGSLIGVSRYEVPDSAR